MEWKVILIESECIFTKARYAVLTDPDLMDSEHGKIF